MAYTTSPVELQYRATTLPHGHYKTEVLDSPQLDIFEIIIVIEYNI